LIMDWPNGEIKSKRVSNANAKLSRVIFFTLRQCFWVKSMY
jgi:hypothetical protein